MSIARQTRCLIGALAILVLLGAFGVIALAWSGVYSVAASRGHWAAMDWFLTFGMQNSVETHAMGITAPSLDDPEMVRLGAVHFQSACAPCHGAPGTPTSAVTQHTLPPPPHLTTEMRPWRDRELFWIVKNGLKYTGMPAWPVQNRDDEVWAMAAFLKRLNGLDEGSYRKLTSSDATVLVAQDNAAPAEPERSSEYSDKIVVCARCHGAMGRAPSSTLVPVLHGQSLEFLMQALADYAARSRASGIMQQAASSLDAADIQQLSTYYSSLPLPRNHHRQGSQARGDDSSFERGRLLAERGDAANRIPACSGCHGPEALPTYPRLAGQSQRYMSNRLKLWRNGSISRIPTDAIMAPIARALNDQQIIDVAAYFSSQAPRRDPR